MPLAVLLAAGTASAQHVDSPLARAGRLRLDVSPTLLSWDSRFGFREAGGSTVGEVEPLGFDLEDPDGVGIVPGTANLESILREALSAQDLTLPLGHSRAQVSAERVRVPFRLDLGVFDWLTVGVTVPLEMSRTAVTHLLQADSSQLGISPALSSPGDVSGFLDEVARALDDVRSNGALGELEQQLELLHDGLIEAYEESALFPAEGTAGGQILNDHLAGLNTSLQGSGIEPIGTAFPLASEAVTEPDDLDDLLVGPGFGYRAGLAGHTGLWQLGDVSVHAAVRLLEGVVRDSAEAPARLRWLVGLGGLVRLPTGVRDDPDVLIDVGSGDGQTDLEGSAFAHFARGRLAAVAEARFGRQLATTLQRRVAPPDVVLPPLSSRRSVEWSPGGYLLFSLSPRFHITPELAFSGFYRYASKSPDEYRESGTGVPANEPGFQGYVGPSWEASVLGEESEWTWHEVGAGMVYSTVDAWETGRTSYPLEVSLSIRSALSGSGGLTPKTLGLHLGVRLSRRLWGS